MTAKNEIDVEEKANPLLALKVRDFRLYWLALVTQVVGQHMFAFTLVLSLVFLSGFLLNIAGSLVGPRWALAGEPSDCACLRLAVAGARYRAEKSGPGAQTKLKQKNRGLDY